MIDQMGAYNSFIRAKCSASGESNLTVVRVSELPVKHEKLFVNGGVRCKSASEWPRESRVISRYSTRERTKGESIELRVNAHLCDDHIPIVGKKRPKLIFCVHVKA